MKQLIIDTSSNLLYIGLLNEDKTSFVTRIGKNDNAAYVVSLVDELLTKNELTINDINTIIVGVGPGSYTGARVAVVVAKTLSYTKNIPLYKISSLALLSSGYENNVTAAIDAKRKHFFVGTYNNGKTIINDNYLEESLISKENFINLDDTTIKVNLINVVNNSTLVENIHDLEPNYLRKTEAETNYDKKNANN